MKNYKDLFKKAVLVQLSSSCWNTSKTLNQAVLNERLGEENDWLRGRKFLINPELLGPIRTATHQARNNIQKFALPFPITSIYLVPKETLSIIDERLQYYKERFWNKVHDFETLYEAAREEAKTVLGDLFNEADYPADILTKFRFEYRFLTLGVPGKTNLLSPEIYEREKEKFQSLMDETRDVAISALREEFGKLVTHLTDKLNSNGGKPKMLKSSMFNKLHEFLDSFGTRNLFDDEKLIELSEQAKSVIGGVSSYGLQYNEVMRRKIQKGMNELKDSVDAAIEEMPRRKMRLAV